MHIASSGQRRLAGVALLLMTAIIWGSSFVVMKDAVDHYPVNYLLALRFSIGGAFLCLLFRRKLVSLGKRGLWGGAAIGLSLYLAYVSQTEGLKGTTPSHNAFLTAIYVVLLPFMQWAFLHQRPGRHMIVAALACITGIGLISLDGSFSISSGDALSLLSGVLFAVQLLLIGIFSKENDAGALAAVQVCTVGVLAWIVAPLTEIWPTAAIADQSTWLPLLYLSIAATGVTQMTQNLGQTMMPPAAASIILSMESVFGALFSVWFYHEQLTAQVLVGFVLVFAAVVISQTGVGRTARPKG